MKGMRWLALAGICGCNAILGIDPIHPVVDAQKFDAPIDAPFACPAPGIAPQFGSTLHDTFIQCAQYSVSSSAGVAMAMCSAGVSFGPIDQMPLAIAPQPMGTIERAMLAPEGDRAFIQSFDTGTNTGNVVEYTRGSNGAWGPGSTVVAGLGSGLPISNPTRATAARHCVYSTVNGLYELVETGTGSWSQVSVHTLAELGLGSIGYPSLSEDGLRLVIGGTAQGQAGIWYADRPTLDAPFGTATELFPGASGLSPFMTSDCARLYFEGPGAQIVYATQL